MATRLSVQSHFGHKSHYSEDTEHNFKRNAWLALLSGSFMFWVLAAVMVWRLWG